MRALCQHYDDLNSAQLPARNHAEQLASGVLANLYADAAQFHRFTVTDGQKIAVGLARRDIDIAPVVERAQIHAGQRIGVRIAPCLVLAGGESNVLGHAAAMTAS